MNGKLTLGENIADYGGLLTAYDALQLALKRNGRPRADRGFTPEQRFFIAYAQSWRTHVRAEALKNRVTVDPHAPERWRANGPLSNMPRSRSPSTASRVIRWSAPRRSFRTSGEREPMARDRMGRSRDRRCVDGRARAAL